jgi:WD40 repeat protein
MSAAFSPDASRIVTGGMDGTVRIWDSENGKEKLTLEANSSWVGCVAFSPDGKRIVSGGAALARDAVARVWDAESGAGLVVLKGHSTDVVESAVFSPDGALIVTTGRNDFARVWDARTGALVSELRQDGHVYNASFFPDSRRVITTGFEGNAKIWDAPSGSGLAELKVQPSELGSATTIAALSPDHEHIMTLTMNVDSKIWRRDHSDAKYGRLLMPEFWMTLALSIALVWSVWRDRRLLRRY